MKLSSFLTEQAFEELDQMDRVLSSVPDTKDDILAILEKVKSKFKFVDAIYDVPINLLKLNFSNGFLHVLVGFRFESKDESKVKAAVIQVSIDKKISIPPKEPIRGADELFKSHIWEFAKKNDVKRFSNEIDAMIKHTDTFTDWYFAVTAEYGKIKVLRTQKDVFNEDSEKVYLALAGRLAIDSNIGGDLVSANVRTEVF